MATVNREVVNGRLTVARARRTKEDGLYVEVLVYAGPEAAKGEDPIGEWVMPIQLRYALSDAARMAEAQTDKTPEKKEGP